MKVKFELHCDELDVMISEIVEVDDAATYHDIQYELEYWAKQKISLDYEIVK